MRVNTLSALMSVIAAGMILSRTNARVAQTVTDYVAMRWWEVVFATLFFISFIWLIAEITKFRPVKFLTALSALWSVVLIANILLPHGAHFSELPRQLYYYQLPWGETVVDLGKLTLNIWHYSFWLLVFVSLAFAWLASTGSYRIEHHRSSVFLNWALAIFSGSLLIQALVNARVINFIQTGDLGYFALVFLLFYKFLDLHYASVSQTRSLLDQLPMAICLKDRDGRYIFANTTFRQLAPDRPLADFDDVEIFGEPLAGTIRANELLVLGNKQEVRSQWKILREGNSLVYKSVQIPVLDGDGSVEGVYGVYIDISDELAKEQAVHQIERQLLRADRLVSTSAITKSLAHEICQPLSAILSNAQAGQRFLKHDNLDKNEAAAIYEDIVRDSKRATAVINGLRSMLQNQEEPYKILDLKSCVLEVVDFMHTELINRSVTVEQKLQSELYVRANETQLKQVLLNLIMNSLDAMEEQTEHRHRLLLAAEKTTDVIMVTVRDNGPGISRGKETRIFEGFFTTKAQGLGVGLEVCKTIVESHQGRIWAHEDVEQGAAISFELPLVARSSD